MATRKKLDLIFELLICWAIWEDWKVTFINNIKNKLNYYDFWETEEKMSTANSKGMFFCWIIFFIRYMKSRITWLSYYSGSVPTCFHYKLLEVPQPESIKCWDLRIRDYEEGLKFEEGLVPNMYLWHTFGRNWKCWTNWS